MYNFTYHNPTRILFGKGQIAQLASEIPAHAKLMLTYGGGSIMKNGVYDQVKKALGDRTVVEFGGIEPNPSYETLMGAVELARKEGVDYLLSVGGGSVLDGTKFIAAAIHYEGADAWDVVSGKGKIGQAIPLGAVLTLPATGSEMNMFSVISRKSTQEKIGFAHPSLYPVFSILDPQTAFSLPPRQIANGIADAFTHVLEQYMTFPVNAPLQDRMAEAVLSTLIEEGPKALANPEDYDAQANLMWAATMALNGVISVGVPQDWATHEIGHEITALHGVDHARTLAVVMPHLFEVLKSGKREKLAQYAQRIWNATGDADQLADLAIRKTAEFYESLGIPTKANHYGMDAGSIDHIVGKFEAKRAKLGERKNVTPQVVREVLEKSIA